MSTPHPPTVPSPENPTARSAAQDLARLGGFFAMTTHPDEEAVPGEGPWRPLEQVWAEDVLDTRIANIRRVFAGRVNITPEEVEPRVAASVLHQGLASRLVSPAMATAVVHGLLLHPDALRWRSVPSGPLPLLLVEDRAIPTPRPDTHGPEATADVIERSIVQGLLEPAATAFRARVKLSPHVLRGNLMSSIAGAARRLEEMLPEHGAPAQAVAEALLASPSLAGTGSFNTSRTVRSTRLGHNRKIRFTRNSCCLYYRLPGAGKCADCVLLRDTEPSR